jgi:hypothetical protein
MAAFGAISALVGRRKPPKTAAPLSPLDLALLSLSVFRLGRMVAYDRITEPLRRPFTRTVPDQTGAGETVEPRQDENGVVRSLGQLIACPICAGTWISAVLVYALELLPNPTRIFLTIFGGIGAAEMLNSLSEAFEWTGQLTRFLSGAESLRRGGANYATNPEATPSGPATLFTLGEQHYVGDHQKYYRQGRP